MNKEEKISHQDLSTLQRTKQAIIEKNDSNSVQIGNLNSDQNKNIFTYQEIQDFAAKNQISSSDDDEPVNKKPRLTSQKSFAVSNNQKGKQDNFNFSSFIKKQLLSNNLVTNATLSTTSFNSKSIQIKDHSPNAENNNFIVGYSSSENSLPKYVAGVYKQNSELFELLPTENKSLFWCYQEPKEPITYSANYGYSYSKNCAFVVPLEIAVEIFANKSVIIPQVDSLSNQVIDKWNEANPDFEDLNMEGDMLKNVPSCETVLLEIPLNQSNQQKSRRKYKKSKPSVFTLLISLSLHKFAFDQDCQDLRPDFSQIKTFIKIASDYPSWIRNSRKFIQTPDKSTRYITKTKHSVKRSTRGYVSTLAMFISLLIEEQHGYHNVKFLTIRVLEY